MSETKQESEIKKLIQDQVRFYHHKTPNVLVLSHTGPFGTARVHRSLV